MKVSTTFYYVVVQSMKFKIKHGLGAGPPETLHSPPLPQDHREDWKKIIGVILSIGIGSVNIEEKVGKVILIDHANLSDKRFWNQSTS